MVFIANLSEQLGLISTDFRNQHIEILSKIGLPVTYSGASFPELLSAMRVDKKSRGNTLRFVVTTEIGKTQRLENPNESELLRAYERLRS
jgi:3-dehydroquinate synthase